MSMVIAPNLFMSLPARHNLDDVTMASKTSQVVRLLIKYHRLLWTVSHSDVCVGGCVGVWREMLHKFNLYEHVTALRGKVVLTCTCVSSGY